MRTTERRNSATDVVEWHTYPVTVLVIGAAGSHLALHATRRVGAATAVALAALAAHAAVVAVYRLLLPPGPVLAAHLLLVPAAMSLDAWCARRIRAGATGTTWWGGVLLYAAVLLAGAVLYIPGAISGPVLDLTTVLESVAAGLPAALVASLLGARIGVWLAEVGRPPAREIAAGARQPVAGIAAVPGPPRGADLEVTARASPTAAVQPYRQPE